MYVRHQRRIQSHIQPTPRVISKHLDIVVTCHRFVVQIVEISRDYKQVYDWSERNSMLKHSHNCRITRIRTVSMHSTMITYTKLQEHAYTCTPTYADVPYEAYIKQSIQPHILDSTMPMQSQISLLRTTQAQLWTILHNLLRQTGVLYSEITPIASHSNRSTIVNSSIQESS